MAPRAEKKEESRAKILASAGRGFRARGFGGLGVDELAKQAGVTSGAFYAHFKSKAAVFQEAIGAGMEDLRAGVQALRREKSDAWLPAFVDFYLGERRRADLHDSCALQSLTGEVARADADAKQVYEDKLREVIGAMTAGEGPPRARAIATLAMLSGAVSMTRAVQDPALQNEIADAVRAAALKD